MLANLVNGEAESSIPVTDRAFHYGDGVFETLRVASGEMTLWPQHRERLLAGCDFLGIPLLPEKLDNDLQRLLAGSPDEGIVKILVSRGSGGRGYQPRGVGAPLRVVQFYSLPDNARQFTEQGIEATVCRHPVSGNSRMSRFKHLCRLDQVLASQELGERFPEGVMLSDDGYIIEGTRSNLFLAVAGELATPSLEKAGVQGVMRQYLLERFAAAGLPVRIDRIDSKDLLDASELFFCNSVFGVWPVKSLVHQQGTACYPHDNFTRMAREFADDAFATAD